MLAPFLQSSAPIRFYPVDGHLQVSETSWIEEIRAGDMVVVIHYFGFPNHSFPAALVKLKGAILVEDASQALFLAQQFRESTCILYSPRKFLGVPDGGIMVSSTETAAESAPLEQPPQAWWTEAVAMSLRRRNFDLTGQPNNWFAGFQRVEAEFPVGLYRASDLSRMLLSAVDYDAIRTRRRANYAQLLDSASGLAVFGELGLDVVPLGFPVRLDAGIRDSVLRRLHAAKIYTPMHWPLEGIVPESFRQSHELALSGLTLLCDQRCTSHDMDRQAREFEASVQAARLSSPETQMHRAQLR
jgi:dTDP-4-amino-4,6-dideoxygalactose transaminase